MTPAFNRKFGFHTQRSLVALLGTAACSFASAALFAFFAANAQTNGGPRTLTFEQRVNYQKAIEEVYWRHRIWPTQSSGSKPSLDSLMPQEKLEKKVTNYLTNSQVIADDWHRPLTIEQLQAEMNRMAAQTKQSEVLRELFEALDNDPFVIAECLARPALVERILPNLYAYDQGIHGGLKQRAQADLVAYSSVEQMKQSSGAYTEIDFVRTENNGGGQRHGVSLNSEEWDETLRRLAATFDRSSAAEMSVGRKNAAVPGDYKSIPVGQVSALQEEESRYYATAVISKSDTHLKVATITWSKESFEAWRDRTAKESRTALAPPSGPYTLPTISDSTSGCAEGVPWESTNLNPPAGRERPPAVWTGAEMIIWGGYGGLSLNTGARYNPSTDEWISTSTSNAPSARAFHTAVWTGTEMIVWGGGYYGGSDISPVNTGGRYDPATDTWTATTTSNAPAARAVHTGVWTGNQMIIWGGATGDFVNYVNTGGRYDPGTDTWTTTTTTNAPQARYFHSAVWTGNEMIVWGGWDFNQDI